MNCVVCNKKLNSRNKIGFCRKHRSRSPQRKAYRQDWVKDHQEQYAESKKQWNRRNLQYFVDYRNKNLSNKIAHSLRVRLRRVVRTGSAVKNLGCSVSEFLVHLEAKFTEGMSWNNYGKWHIDHIRPLSSFDLTDPLQLAAACNYKNLQPLWAFDNISKNGKLEYTPKSA
jgi:hypothetical protein